MKRILLFLCSIITAFSMTGKQSKTASLSITIKGIDPLAVIFCWDIHDTLVARDRKKYRKMIIQLIWQSFFRCKQSRSLVRKAKASPYALEYTEAALLNLAKQYREKSALATLQGKKRKARKYCHTAEKLQKIAQIMHNFELTYTHKDGMVELLQALKKHGYTHHYVASNIGINRYQEMKQKFPDIFNESMVQDGLTVDSWETPAVKKPDYMYFKKLQKMFNPHGDKTLIFVDDNQDNINAANACGIIGIRIHTAQQLVKDLNAIGFNLNYTTYKQCVNGTKQKAIQIL